MRITRTNTILYCRNWEETVGFYTSVLGLKPTVQKDWFLELQLSEQSYLSIADERRATVKSSSGAGITISLRVDSVGNAWKKLVERGASPGRIRRIWGSEAFYLFDPEGNRLELWS